MNTYNLFNNNEPATILFHAIASNEDHVQQLAAEAKLDISDLTIELERKDVKNELGRDYLPTIETALIQ